MDSSINGIWVWKTSTEPWRLNVSGSWIVHRFEPNGNWSYLDNPHKPKVGKYSIRGNKFVIDGGLIQANFILNGDKLTIDNVVFSRATKDEESAFISLRISGH